MILIGLIFMYITIVPLIEVISKLVFKSLSPVNVPNDLNIGQ